MTSTGGVDFSVSSLMLNESLSLPKEDIIQDERGVRLARVEED